MDSAAVSGAIREAVRRAVCGIPEGVEGALAKARQNEKNQVARIQLDCILENIRLAGGKTPVCQDTGTAIFFVRAPYSRELEAAILDGFAQATKGIPLRPNSFDAFSRKPLGNIPIINWEHPAGDFAEIEFLPKGGGSENAGALAMLKPSEGIEGVERFVLQTVLKNARNACPPILIGIGIGSTADTAMSLAKKALLREGPGDDDELEKRLLEKINSLGIGAMGLGGSTTCIGVKIGRTFCHPTALPVAVNIQCWAHRHAKIRVYGDGKIEHL